MNTNIKLFTLFSGYESQMMALEVATSNSTLKAELVGWSEIDTIVQAVHNAAYPEYADRCYPDVTKIDWDTVGDIDILFASSPCQDVSRAGVRKGMQKDSETRSSLVWEVEKAIKIKRPKWFIEENVEGMLDSIEDFEALVRSISSYGYVCFHKVLKGCDFGIPQNRPRMFLVAARIDEGEPYPTFKWPETMDLKIAPEDLLSDFVDDRFYLSEEETAVYTDLLQHACDGYTPACTTNGNAPTRFYNKQFTRRINRLVTPLCKNGAVPTLTTSLQGRCLESMAGCRKERQACVVEIWEGVPGLKPIKTNEKPFDRKIKALKTCCDAERVLDFMNTVKEGQYIRVRDITPEESLRLMGVRDKHISQIMAPREHLLKAGYTEQRLKGVLRNRVCRDQFSDYTLYGRAGNSIIVDVMAAIFSEIIKQGYSSPEKGIPDTAKERRRRTSKSYYERNKDEIRRKSREYHKARRQQLKQLKGVK